MDRIKLGVIGLRFGATVIEELQASEEDRQYMELAGVYDLDPVKTANITNRFGVKGYTSLEEMLQDPELEAIAVYTPPTGRSDLLLQIMQSGKHIMTTKPFEDDWRKAEKILRQSQQMGKVIHLNSPGVVENGLVQAMQEAAATYHLGRPVGARCDVWVNYHEKPDGSWYDSFERCPAAPIFRLGIYIINDLVSIFGKATCLSVFGSRLVTERPTMDNTLLAVQYQNGALASIYGSFCVDDGQRYKGPMTVNFEKGTFYYQIFPNGELAQPDLLLTRKDSAGNTVTHRIPVGGPSKGKYLWHLFYEDIRNGRVVTDVYIDRIVEGVRVLQGMKRAEKEHQIVELDAI